MMVMCNASVDTEYGRRRSGLPSAPLDMICTMLVLIQSMVEEVQGFLMHHDMEYKNKNNSIEESKNLVTYSDKAFPKLSGDKQGVWTIIGHLLPLCNGCGLCASDPASILALSAFS